MIFGAEFSQSPQLRLGKELLFQVGCRKKLGGHQECNGLCVTLSVYCTSRGPRAVGTGVLQRHLSCSNVQSLRCAQRRCAKRLLATAWELKAGAWSGAAGSGWGQSLASQSRMLHPKAGWCRAWCGCARGTWECVSEAGASALLCSQGTWHPQSWP